MELTRRRLDWSFWLIWVLANAVGFGVGVNLAFILIFPRIDGSADRAVSVLMAALGWSLVGLVLGISQIIVLPGCVKRAGWVMASCAGWIVGAFVVSATPFHGLLWMAVVSATLISVLQSLLFRLPLNHTLLWIAANALGWGVGAYVLAVLPFPFAWIVNEPASFWVLAVTGAVGGAVTGLALIVLLTRAAHA